MRRHFLFRRLHGSARNAGSISTLRWFQVSVQGAGHVKIRTLAGDREREDRKRESERKYMKKYQRRRAAKEAAK